MKQPVNLEQVEQDARRVFNQDGLIYLFLGIVLVMLGIGYTVPGLSWLGATAIFLVIPFEAIRKRITYPRLGYARFTLAKGTALGILGFAVVAAIVLAVMALGWNGRFQRYLPILIGIIFALSLYFGSSMYGTRWRDWGIMALMLASGVVVALQFNDWHRATAVQFSTVGLLVFLLGIIDLVRFVRTYPVSDEETA